MPKGGFGAGKGQGAVYGVKTPWGGQKRPFNGKGAPFNGNKSVVQTRIEGGNRKLIVEEWFFAPEVSRG